MVSGKELSKLEHQLDIEETFGLIKPETIERNLVNEIKNRIKNAGLIIEEKKRMVMTIDQFDLLYGHTKQKKPAIYEPMKEYMTSNSVEVLRISGVNAVERLLLLRGSSNPAEALPGTIRGDYAKDQDYKVLYERKKPALNVFHASDSREEARRDLKAFFGDEYK